MQEECHRGRIWTVPQLRAHFENYIRQQEAICLELELIADGLPDRIDPYSSLITAQRLLPLVKRAHAFEEDELFPKLLADFSPPSEFVNVIERLKFEHWGDEDFAEQVYHQIREFIASGKRGKAEQLAWTLRGFFQSMRRHIEFEREFLLPMVQTTQ
jgi:hypothetical protein